MDNGPAKKINTSSEIQAAGDILADPFEISTIRRDVSIVDGCIIVVLLWPLCFGQLLVHMHVFTLCY
jgi:hypothetical protein